MFCFNFLPWFQFQPISCVHLCLVCHFFLLVCTLLYIVLCSAFVLLLLRFTLPGFWILLCKLSQLLLTKAHPEFLVLPTFSLPILVFCISNLLTITVFFRLVHLCRWDYTFTLHCLHVIVLIAHKSIATQLDRISIFLCVNDPVVVFSIRYRGLILCKENDPSQEWMMTLFWKYTSIVICFLNELIIFIVYI